MTYIKLNLETNTHWESVFFSYYVSALELTLCLPRLLNKTIVKFQIDESYSVGNLNPMSPHKDFGKSNSGKY